jgi:hypothetical protein
MTEHATGNMRLPDLAARAAAIAFTRIFIGVMWLFEITVGHNWKIGGLGSGPNPLWIGDRAGESVTVNAQQALDDGTWAGAAWLFQNLVMPYPDLAGYLVIALQVALVFSFIVGFGVRPFAIAALAMDLSIFMLGNSRIPPFFSVAHLFVLVTNAGMYYGLDGFIMQRTQGSASRLVRLVRWGITLPILRPSWLLPAALAAGLFALFFLLTTANRPTNRMAMVGLDLAVIGGLVAMGLYAATRIPDRLAVLAACVRVFIGYKFLHEIWTRTAPGLNALPGFAGPEAQTPVFEGIVANHWEPAAWLVELVVLPAMPFWVVVFGAVQLAVGLMLLLGYRTRLGSVVGLLFLGALVALGMTRYAPFLLGLLIPVLALDGGRVLSLDALRDPNRPARYGLPIPVRVVPALIALSGVFAAAAAVTAIGMDIVPDAYLESMRSMTAAFTAIFLGLLAFVGWLQRHPRLDFSGEVTGLPQTAASPSD